MNPFRARALQVALDPPRAHGMPLVRAQARLSPEDFKVSELLSFEPSDEGPHWLLQVEKRSANTRWVAQALARLAGVPPLEVGFAGMKDRHALTCQWFSVPAAAHDAVYWRQVCTPEFRVLSVRANRRKLRRGALHGNCFQIRLHAGDWPVEGLQERLEQIRSLGVPGYFGPQRFGHGGSNLLNAFEWAERGVRPAGRGPREFALSAARACIFNAVLAERVVAGSWRRAEEGEEFVLEGSNSHFAGDFADPDLRERIHRFDVHPSGPLWGRGEPASQAEAGRRDRQVARESGALAQLLESQGLVQERRALRMAVHDLQAHCAGSWLTLSFRLARGQFATAVLREICELEVPDGSAFADQDPGE